MRYPILLFVTLALGCCGTLNGQPLSFSSPRWTFEAERSELVDFQGRPSLLLQTGRAILPDVAFLDGIIEFDVFMNGDRAFPGCFFRMQDEINFEEFYVRPHQSGNPDANQYTPVFNGVPAWQLYHGPAYNKAYAYPSGKWMHVRLVVSGGQAEVYFNQDAEPALFIPNLMQARRPGPVGLTVTGSPVYFSNFSCTVKPQPALRGKPEPVPVKAPPAGLITEWELSAVFPEKALDGKTTLSAADRPSGEWSKLAAEPTGITNLARLRVRTPENNTVFVRLIIDADSAAIRRLDFGYSDRVRLYCNDQLLYSGDYTFQSRDYRFLGTIGFFDSLYLPLRKGRNEILLAVSETFGGWGVLGKLSQGF